MGVVDTEEEVLVVSEVVDMVMDMVVDLVVAAADMVGVAMEAVLAVTE